MTAGHPRRPLADRFAVEKWLSPPAMGCLVHGAMGAMGAIGVAMGVALLSGPALAGAAVAPKPDFSSVVGGSSAGAAVPTASSAPAAPVFDHPVVPSHGRQVAEMAVAEFGRYSVSVASPAGMSLQLIDRMSGPSPIDGVAGERNGRIDAFLDRGATRVVVTGAALGRGEARLAAQPFRELEPTPVQLVEGRAVATSLGDLEQRSWWIEVRDRREVMIEAAGRHLADLRLWQNGSWLVDAPPLASTVEPVKGRPLALRQIVATLESGLYRVTAYGGLETPWSLGGTSGDRPLHVRFGLDQRRGAGREAHTVSPFGFDRYVLPGSSTLVRLESPAPPAGASLELQTAEWAERTTLPVGDDMAGQVAELSKETSPPFVALRRGRTTRPFVALVRGLAGQPYTLQHLSTSRRASLDSQPARRWVGTVHAGSAADSLDATGVLFAVGNQPRVLAAQTIELSPTRGYRRRFNLFETAELFLHLAERTTFDLVAEGLAAQFRLEPLLYTQPSNYRAPAARSAPTSWTLDPGYYVLSLQPSEGGVLDLSLSPKGAGAGALAANGSVQGAVNLGEVNLQNGTSYVLWTSNQGGVESGLISRELPLDLSEPLPLALRAGEERSLRFRAGESGRLRAIDDQGGTFEIRREDGSSPDSFEPGEQTVKIRNTATETRLATVTFEGASLAAVGPLPAIAPETLAALPAFDRLREGTPISFELAQGGSRTFLVEAAEPGLYTVETQGLLAIAGVLRTRVEPALLSAEQNGVGRNVALRTYLREGDYQLTVRTLGLSAGDASVVLSRARLRDGGELAPGVAERVTLPAGEAVAHRLNLTRPERIHLEALRLGGRFEIRVEDLEGWPVAAPWTPGDVELDLAAGSYRTILAPRALDARALVRYIPVVETLPLVGHGPHRLTLDRNVEAEWNEPAVPEASLRRPDHYTFDLPAAASVDIVLTDEMQGHVWRKASEGQPMDRVIELAPGRPSRLGLAAGSYEMDVVCSRRDNKHRYQLRVSPVEWVDGIDREVTAPAEVALSVGKAGTVELSSYGDADVRAVLFDASGRPLASADDRPDDWNFLLGRNLPAGRYRLRLDPVGATSATTRLALRLPAERTEATLTSGERRTLPLGDEIVLLPLGPSNLRLIQPGADAEVFAASLSAAAGATARLHLALERLEGDAWATLASGVGERPWVALPLDEELRRSTLRLRLGSLDHRPLDGELATFVGAPAKSNEAALQRGIRLAPLGTLPIAAAAVALDRPGCFSRLDTTAWQSRRAAEAAKPRGTTLASSGSSLWFFQEGRAGAVTARRVAVSTEPLRLPLAPGERIVCDLSPAQRGGQSPEGLRVVTVTSLAGQPFVALPAAPRRDHGTAVAPRTALLVAPSTVDRVEISNASATTIEALASVRTVSGAQLERSALPAGPKRLRLGLPAGGWAVVGSPGAPDATLAAFGEANETTLDSAATEITVFAPEADSSGGSRGSRLESFALPELRSAPSAFPSGRLEVHTDRSGRLRREVPAGAAARRLRIRGARATFVSSEGEVTRSGGQAEGAIELGTAAGTLELDQPPGFALAWFDDSAAEEFGPVGSIFLPAALALGAPRQAFAFDVTTPAILVVRSAGPAAVSVSSGSANLFEAFVERTSFAAPVAAGRVTLGLAGLAGEPLVGSAEVTLEPLAEAREGLTPPFLLPSGGTRGFAFTLDRESDVGFGVASDTTGTGEVETVLFDAQGRERNRGAVQRHVLPAGRWVLAVRGAPTAPAASVRLGIVGLAPPSEAPPREEVRRFLALASQASGNGDGRGVQGSETLSDPFFEPGSENDEDDEYDSDDEGCRDCEESWDESEGEGEGR